MHPQFKPPPGWPTIDEAEGPFVRPAWSKPRTPDGRLIDAPAPDAFMDTPNGPVGLYTHPPQRHADSEPERPPPPAQRDPWPTRMLAGGASTAAVLGVIGHYGPGLSQAGHAAEMAGIGVAATCAGLGALVMLVKGGGSKSGQNVHVSVNVHATGGNARASSRSRSK
jgi:hypothetical protein